VPEGDAVFQTARRLHHALAGRVLITWDLRWPSLATTDLRGHAVREVIPAGKHILMRVDGGLTLHSHLRMDGSWRVVAGGDLMVASTADRVRAVLGNREWTAIGHRLGLLDLVATDAEHTLVGHLGPDVLGPAWDAAEAARRIIAAAGRPIGETLLDQRVLAGVGTIYASETLFLRGVDPQTPCADLGADAVTALVDLVHRTMTVNRDRRGGHGAASAEPVPLPVLSAWPRRDRPAQAALSWPSARNAASRSSGTVSGTVTSLTTRSSPSRSGNPSATATRWLTWCSTEESGTSRAPQIEASSSLEASFCPRSTSLR
jgi:endonuclease-8